MDLTLGVNDVAGRAVIRVGGDVDIDTAPALRSAVVDLLEDGRRDIVVDVSAVDFIDSTGLGVLVGALKDTQSRQGTLELICTQRKMLGLLRLTGLDEAFTVHEADIAGTG
ncbi:STAS domain-containing protein [Nocardioides marmorisolisilvae]|uniref:Anti-sigma factor antagonist n=1 Tax=Nocardioides marmorisolisilvae TaxID=1542737 RepID=A0A3N0DU34_9ACTN|nr:STAS domain-containing protein [Nocardioides marmorisolisilvae]RNL79147.1 anti-sigma factor antagonist [Nocardioides marmorisolisilvae]